MVGARGCPYDCSFCGAAVSANPDITIRTRDPHNILAEMYQLRDAAVTAFRFVDDLFLGARRVIETMMAAFSAERVSDWAVWDATGRINVLSRASDAMLDVLARNGLREVALGIESGSQRILTLIDKRIGDCCVDGERIRLIGVVPRSDGEGEFSEGRREPMLWVEFHAEFVVAAADVLDECVSGADHAGRAEPFEATHRPESTLESPMIGLDRIIPVLLHDMACGRK
jgi:hypothetical protein